MGCKNCRPGNDRKPGGGGGPDNPPDDPGGGDNDTSNGSSGEDNGGNDDPGGDGTSGGSSGGGGGGGSSEGTSGNQSGDNPPGTNDPGPTPPPQPPGTNGKCVDGYHEVTINGVKKCVADTKPTPNPGCPVGWKLVYTKTGKRACVLEELPKDDTLPCPSGYILSFHNNRYVCRKDGPGYPPDPCDPTFLCEDPGYHPWDNNGRCDQCLAPPSKRQKQQLADGSWVRTVPRYKPEEFKANMICVGGNSTVITCTE